MPKKLLSRLLEYIIIKTIVIIYIAECFYGIFICSAPLFWWTSRVAPIDRMEELSS